VDPGVSQPWVYQYYTNAVFSEDATPVSVATNSTTLGVDLTLAGGGFLAGQLRRAGGQPVANVDIDVFDLRGARMEINAVSGTDGSYLVGALPGGDYVFRADPEPLQFLARTYYSNAIRSEQAQAVTVTPGTTNAPLDITMAAAGVISGSVFDTNGSALAGIDIDAYDATTGVRVEGNGTSSGNGSYMFGPLRPGTYLVRADPDATQGYVREYFAEVPRKSQANAVTVSADAVTTNIVLTLAPGAAILGRVTDRSSTPLMSIDIDVFPTGGGTPLDQTALTNPDGTYAVGPVPEGMWAVRAHASAAQGYETRYYESAGMISNAAPVAITGGVIVTGIDFSLGTNRSPVAALTAFGGFLSPTGFVVDATASTDANGDRLLVAWRQTGGSPVLLINSNATVATIALPPGYPPGELIELEFVVSDFSTSTTSSTIVVRNGAPLIMDMGHSASQTLYFTWSLGTQAQPYAILTSTNLLSWEQIDSVNTFRHETSPEDAKRFYGIGAP
jgi:hypothetical protein